MIHQQITIHAVWRTRYNDPVMTQRVRDAVFAHIKQQAFEEGIHVHCVSGSVDHVHVLFDLPVSMSIDKALQYLKGESAHWANAIQLTTPPLRWAKGYFASAVSPSGIPKVREYIERQELHHSEYIQWIESHLLETNGSVPKQKT